MQQPPIQKISVRMVMTPLKSSTERKRRSGGIVELLRGSFAVRIVSRFTDFIYRKASQSLVGSFLTGDIGREPTPVGHTTSSENRLRRLRRRVMTAFDSSTIVCTVKRGMESLFSMTMKYYGIFCLTFGLSLALSSLYLGRTSGGYIESTRMLAGSCLLLASLVMLFSDATLGEAICSSRACDAVIFRFLGIRREIFEYSGRRHKGYTAFAAGLVLGLLSLKVSPLYIFVAIIGVIVMYIVLASPEAGVIIMFACLPFLTTMMLVGITLWTTLSYAIKVLRGKRTFRFDSFDVVMLLFGFVLFLGGFFSSGGTASLKASLVFCCFMLGYFLVANLLRTTERIERMAAAMLIAALIVAAVGVFQYVTGSAESTWQDTTMFSDISGRVVSTFANPNVLAEYLVMMLPICGAMLITSKRGTERAFYPLTFIMLGLCLVFTWSRGAWLGFLAGAAMFLLIWSRKFMVAGWFGLMAVPALPFILPPNIVSRFASIGNISDGSTSYRVSIWKGVSKIIKEYFFSGIGVGEAAFKNIYPLYSHEGIELAPHSHSLYFQILVEVGILGLILFVALMALFFRGSFSFFDRRNNIYPYEGREALRLRMLSAAGMCGIMSMLIQGFTDYVWYNYRIFLMFWMVIGFTVAIGRAVRENTLSPDRYL